MKWPFAKRIVGMCVFAGMLIISSPAPVSHAAGVADPPATASEALAADVAGYRIVNGVLILPIMPGNEATVQGLFSSLAQDPDFQGISMTLFTPVGARPRILLSGNQGEDRLRHAAEKLKTIVRKLGQPHRLVIAAYLREITIENDDDAGVSWFPNGAQGGLSTGVTTTYTRQWDSNGATPPSLNKQPTVTKTTSGYTVGLTNPVNVTASLTKAMSKGKVIVGSEVNVVNGTTAEIKNDDSLPVPLLSNGVVTFNTQVISSDVRITPTIVKYNAEKPEESVVRLDVVVQLSVPTDTVTFTSGSSALQYTVQTLTSTLYAKANNERIIGGLFASDTWIKSTSGIPILMNIPVLKYLFSSESVSLQHSASILTLAVRILPVTEGDGYAY